MVAVNAAAPVTVRWSSPLYDGVSGIVAYEVTASPSLAATTPVIVSAPTMSVTFQASVFALGHAYTFTVIAGW
jgi:hypothetical protein